MYMLHVCMYAFHAGIWNVLHVPDSAKIHSCKTDFMYDLYNL